MTSFLEKTPEIDRFFKNLTISAVFSILNFLFYLYYITFFLLIFPKYSLKKFPKPHKTVNPNHSHLCSSSFRSFLY
ncbi:hypothetical protein IKF81_02995 [Candidatus Saccharibacteria bacterium]|nr:hypothetical protein [Candidatus Saccharibacteria bacterium]